jgi:hypothetical protein
MDSPTRADCKRHATGIRTTVAIKNGLVITGQRHHGDRSPIAEGMPRDFARRHSWLDGQPFSSLSQCAQLVDGNERFFRRGRDNRALAHRESVRFDDHGADRSHVGFRRFDIVEALRGRVGNAMTLHQGLGPRLARLQASRRAARAKSGDARRLKGVDQTPRERVVGRHKHEVHVSRPGEAHHRFEICCNLGRGRGARRHAEVDVHCDLRRARVSRCDKQLRQARRLQELPGDGVLAPA